MKRKIKILEAIRQGKVGGGETHVLELCTHMDREIFEPVVLSFTHGPMVDELTKRGIRTKVIETENAFDFKVWKKVLDYIRDENFDIVHAHGTRAMSNVLYAAKKARLPIIYTVHGWSFHIDQKPWVKRIRILSEHFLTSRANKTICVSKSNQQDGFKHFGINRSKVIYNAVNFNKFSPYRNDFKDIRQELGISTDKLVIGFIARITGQKDPFTMLKAIKKISEQNKNIVLLMVGDGDLKAKTVKLAKKLRIEEQVIFQPFRSDIPDILNACDIYCLPSLWEGFPIGILEAMAMKKAVIASPVDGNTELVEDGKTGLLVTLGNSDMLAEAIMLLDINAELKDTLGSNAYSFVTNNFGIEQLARSVENEYHNLLLS